MAVKLIKSPGLLKSDNVLAACFHHFYKALLCIYYLEEDEWESRKCLRLSSLALHSPHPTVTVSSLPSLYNISPMTTSDWLNVSDLIIGLTTLSNNVSNLYKCMEYGVWFGSDFITWCYTEVLTRMSYRMEVDMGILKHLICFIDMK